MRTEEEIFSLIVSMAEKDERIRLVMLEGSRTNPNVVKDEFQDYDITYFVTEMTPFINYDKWLEHFGKRLITQTPEDMALFPAEEVGYSYLMTFSDGVKIDLTLLPIDEFDHYLNHSDGLIQVLLDKDERIKHLPPSTDQHYHIKKPSAEMVDDCLNEFWHVATYVVKGMRRKQFLYAVYHFEAILRHELIRMLSWSVGIKTNFSMSLGKQHHQLATYLSSTKWNQLLATYRLDSWSNLKTALLTCIHLMNETAQQVTNQLNYPYPDYEKKVFPFIEKHLKVFEDTIK